jgi:ApbE superfamily uncharacterized protein (UPF0280 family)
VPFRFRETIAIILADDPAHMAAAKAGIFAARREMEAYITRDPFFAATFDPYVPDPDDLVITRMAGAARKAGVGPSISFGIADAVTIFSHDVALPDAWATAVCNAIRPDDRSVLERIDPLDVDGVFAIMGDVTAEWGVLPPLVPAVVDEQLISAGDRQ